MICLVNYRKSELQSEVTVLEEANKTSGSERSSSAAGSKDGPSRNFMPHRSLEKPECAGKTFNEAEMDEHRPKDGQERFAMRNNGRHDQYVALPKAFY